MSDALYAQALVLADTFAQKQHIKGLNEFEYKLYEKLCVALTTYFHGMHFAFQSSAMQTEMECKNQEPAYLAFLAKLQAAEAERERLEHEDEKKEPPEEPAP